MAVLGAAAAVLFGVDVAVLTLRRQSHPVSLDRSVERYRREATSTVATGPTSTTAEDASGGPGGSGPGVGAANASTSTTTRAQGGPSGGGQPTTPHGRPRPADAWRPPAPGVYTYQTEGSARFRIARHDYPAETHAILQAGAGCNWSLEHNLLQEDVDQFDYCTEDDRFQWFSWKISRSFFGVRQSWAYRCRGLGATREDAAARGFTVDCTTDNGDRAVGTGSFAGIDDLAVGGATVRAYHFVMDVELQGSFRGRLTGDLWLEGTSGLRVRERRTIDGSIPAGPYHEELSLDLVSLQPAT